MTKSADSLYLVHLYYQRQRVFVIEVGQVLVQKLDVVFVMAKLDDEDEPSVSG